jgi:hypothetical protein
MFITAIPLVHVAMTRFCIGLEFGGPCGACSALKHMAVGVRMSAGAPFTNTRVAGSSRTMTQGWGLLPTVNKQPLTVS